METQQITGSFDELKKIVGAKKAVIGTKVTLFELKQGKLSKVYLAKNTKKDIREDIEKFAKLSKTEIISLDIKNDELGLICKKPFSISVLGQIK